MNLNFGRILSVLTISLRVVKGKLMRFLIIGLLIGFPLAEGTLLYRLAAGPEGHGGWVLAWLVFAAMAGIALIKQARFSLISRLATALSQGQFSLAAFIDSFRTVLAGLLLIFPGVISDVMAIALLLIPVREPATMQPQGHADSNSGSRAELYAATRRANAARGSQQAQTTHPSATTVDGEFRRET